MIEEEIFKIAENGDGYAAIEKSSVLIRRYKRRNNIMGAIHFLMELSHKLGDLQQWQAATQCAFKGINLFPTSETHINSNLKQLFVKYAQRVPEEGYSLELYRYFYLLIECFYRDTDNVLELKLFDLSLSQNDFIFCQSY